MAQILTFKSFNSGNSGEKITPASKGIGSLFKLMASNTLNVTAASSNSNPGPEEATTYDAKLSTKNSNGPLISGFESLLVAMGSQGQMVNDVSQVRKQGLNKGN